MLFPRKLILILILLVIPSFADAYPAKLELKSGVDVYGDIINEGTEHILMDVFDVEIKYYRDEIKDIERDVELPEPEPVELPIYVPRPSTPQRSVPPVVKPQTRIPQPKAVPNATTVPTREKIAIPMQMAAASGDDIQNYLRSTVVVIGKLNDTLIDYRDEFVVAKKQNDRQKIMRILVEKIRAISDFLDEFNTLATPTEANELKKLMTYYYETMMVVEGMVLKSLTGEKQDLKEIQKFVQRLQMWEKKSSEELNRMLDTFDLASLKAGSGSISPKGDALSGQETQPQIAQNPPITPDNFEFNMRNLLVKSKLLLQETQQLYEVNQRIQNDTKKLLEANKIVHQQQVTILDYESIIQRIKQKKQETHFRRYLYEL